MADFPSISAPNGVQQKTIKAQYKGQSAAGYMMTRAKATLAKKEFSITYKTLTATERNTLQTFFDTNLGTSFNWAHPETGGSTYVVVFMEDEISFEWKSPYYWGTTFIIREV